MFLTKYLLIHQLAVIFDPCDDGWEHEVALRAEEGGEGRDKARSYSMSEVVIVARIRSVLQDILSCRSSSAYN